MSCQLKVRSTDPAIRVGDSESAVHAASPVKPGENGKQKAGIPSFPEKRLTSMLLAHGKAGVVAKLMAKRTPGSSRWLADHSTFSALNLDGVSAPAATGKRMSISRQMTPEVDQVQLMKVSISRQVTPDLGQLRKASASMCGGKREVTGATETSAGCGSDLDTGSSSSDNEAAPVPVAQQEPSSAQEAGFMEIRDLYMRFRHCSEAIETPSEIVGLRASGLQLRIPRAVPEDMPRVGASTPLTGTSTPHRSPTAALPPDRAIFGSARRQPFEPEREQGHRRSKGGETDIFSMPFPRMRSVSCDPHEELKRSVRSYLNKVCPENITSIAENIAEIRVQNADELEVIIELVFKKALAEPHYCETYADLIFCLKSAFPEFPPPGEGRRPITFKSSVLNICQNEFESLPATLEPTEEEKSMCDEEELEFAMKQRKDRMIANMKLIGHIFLRQLLPAKVIVSVMRELLLCDEDALVPEEHTIECACELLLSTGLTLESMPAGLQAVEQVCDRLLDLKGRKNAAGKGVYSKRLQFLVQDMLDVRAAGWTKKSFKSSAKTKEEVRLAQQRDLNAQQKGAESPAAEKVVVGQRPVYISTIIGG